MIRSPRVLLAFALLATALLACQAAPTATAPPGTPAPPDEVGSIEDLRARLDGQSVVIGTSASRNAALTGVRRTVQFLEDDYGLEIDYRELDSDPLVAAMLSGQVNVGQLSLAGVISANEADANFEAFAGDDRNNVYIVVAKAPISSLEELRGQPFAATQNLQQITGQSARACLDSAGLDIERDVQLLRLGNTGEIMQAIRGGQVIGGITAPHRLFPLIVEEGEDQYRTLCRAMDVANQINNVWMATGDWLEENQDLALAIAISAMKTGRWSHENQQEWVDLAMEIDESLVPEAAELAYQTYVVDMNQWPLNGALDRDLCDATIQAAVDSGVVEGGQLACDDVVTFEFQERAVELLGSQ